MLVVAPAGCGKTEALAARAADLIRRGIVASPRRLLALTFSNRATRNLRERILGIFFARFTGEDLFGTKSQNELDGLFMLSLLMSNLVWGIAIPFWMIEPSSLPLSAGILAGLMWVPFSWILKHWVGLFHGITRTVLIVTAWFLFPDHRFVAIPWLVNRSFSCRCGGCPTRSGSIG